MYKDLATKEREEIREKHVSRRCARLLTGLAGLGDHRPGAAGLAPPPPAIINRSSHSPAAPTLRTQGDAPATASKPKSGKRKEGGAAAPRVKSPYQLWCDDNRAAIKGLHPDALTVNIMQLCADGWKEASAQVGDGLAAGVPSGPASAAACPSAPHSVVCLPVTRSVDHHRCLPLRPRCRSARPTRRGAGC